MIIFYLIRVSGIILTNIQNGNNLQILFSFNSPFISLNSITHSKPASYLCLKQNCQIFKRDKQTSEISSSDNIFVLILTLKSLTCEAMSKGKVPWRVVGSWLSFDFQLGHKCCYGQLNCLGGLLSLGKKTGLAPRDNSYWLPSLDWLGHISHGWQAISHTSWTVLFPRRRFIWNTDNMIFSGTRLSHVMTQWIHSHRNLGHQKKTQPAPDNGPQTDFLIKKNFFKREATSTTQGLVFWKNLQYRQQFCSDASPGSMCLSHQEI